MTLLLEQMVNGLQLLFHAIHLCVVTFPDFAPLHGLPLGHLRRTDNLVHEVAEQPHRQETERHQNDEE